MPPTYVERIDVLNKRYFFGKVQLNGIVAIHTNNHDGLNSTHLGKKIPLVPIQLLDLNQKATPNSRIPKLNSLLYWNPIIDHKSGDYQLEFITSEVKGKYEIRIEGIDNKGNAISRRQYFEVR